MNQRNKNITLLIILSILFVSSVILTISDKPVKNTIRAKNLFTLQDTSRVRKISIVSGDKEIHLLRNSNSWQLNDSFEAEKNIVKVLLSILKDVEVERNVSKDHARAIEQELKNHGYLVNIEDENSLLLQFYVKGNDNKTESFMMRYQSQIPYLVNIPGYDSYVAGIFEIPANDWRDRTILNASWRSIQQLHIQYQHHPEYDVNIKFDFNFLSIDGVEKLDTTKMMHYLAQYNPLQADRYIDQGQYRKYDSLLNTTPTVKISVRDIKPENTKSMEFFPAFSGDPMMLAYIPEDKQMVLFESKRIKNIFAIKDDFVHSNANSPANKK